MKQEIRKEKMDGLNIPKLKGRTTIVLKNAETGDIEQKVVEENMVTDAIAKIFASNWLGSSNYTSLMPIAKKLTGGVLCFENSLVEEGSNTWIPKDNNIVAHAGQTVYTQASDDSTRGLPNDGQTAETTNGFVLTFDFPRTQGNGTISTICLTHADFGDFALNGLKKTTPILPVMNSTVRATGGWKKQFQLATPKLFNKTLGCAYSFSCSGTTMTVRKFHKAKLKNRLAISSENLFGSHTEDFDITLKREWNSPGYGYYYNEATDELHLLNGSGSTMYQEIVDFTNKTSRSANFTVPNASLFAHNTINYSRSTRIVLTSDNYFYWAKADSSTVYKIKWGNPTDVTQCESNFTETGYFYSGGQFKCGDLVIYGSAMCLGDKAYECQQTAEINSVEADETSPMKFCTSYQMRNDGAQNYIGSVLAKPYLATINNLSSPVTKTAAQTMSITYELIEVAE